MTTRTLRFNGVPRPAPPRSNVGVYDAVRKLLDEVAELEAHRHGFADPNCQKCARLQGLKSMLRMRC